MQDPVGQRREDQVGFLGRHTRGQRPFRVQVAEADVHQRGRLDDVRRRALHHGHVRVVLPERPADVEGRVVRPDHHDLLSRVRGRAGMLRRVVLFTREDVLAGQVRDVRLTGHSGREDEVLRRQRDLLTVPVHQHGPRLGLRVEGGRPDGRGRPVRHLHHPGVHLQPVGDLVLRREHRPVLRERQVRQVVVPRPGRAGRGSCTGCATDRRGGRAGRAPGRARRAAAAGRPARCRPARHRSPPRTAAGRTRARWSPPRVPPSRTSGLAQRVADALGPAVAERLLEALELAQRGEQRPRALVLEPQVAGAARRPPSNRIQASVTRRPRRVPRSPRSPTGRPCPGRRSTCPRPRHGPRRW